MHKPTVLFVCTGNAGRSQMAEALFQQRFGNMAETVSAGVEPWAALHPMAVRLMTKHGIDLTGRFPKHISRFANVPLDVIVTIGDRAGAEAGTFREDVRHLHWDISDPADADGTPESAEVFRRTCEAITGRFPELAQTLMACAKMKPRWHPAMITTFDTSLSFDQALGMIREAGFSIVSVGGHPVQVNFATPEGRAALRQALARHDLTAESVHAPFPDGDRLFALDDTERHASIRLCRHAIDAAAELDGRIAVIHLIQPYDIPHGEERDRMIIQGRRSVETLVEYAVLRGVKLALENGQRADYDQVLADFLTEFPAEVVGLCYDSGHEHVQGRCCDLLEQFGQRLLTLHLHDNQGWDSHLLPFEGTLPWERFYTTLCGLPYAGNLLLEAGTAHSQFTDPAIFLAEARSRIDRLQAGSATPLPTAFPAAANT